MEEVKKDLTVTDAIALMEERKRAAGLYETRGKITSDDQIRQMWVSLDLDVEEVNEAVVSITENLVACVMTCLQEGIPAAMALNAVWADAFAVGVLYERQRSAT